MAERRRYLDYDAKLSEVLAEVSLADVGRNLKASAAGLGCFLAFMIFIALVNVGRSAAGMSSNLGIPNAVWLWIFFAIYAPVLMGERCWHDWRMAFYYPKASFGSWLATVTYAALSIAAYEFADSLTGKAQTVGIMAVWVVFGVPSVIFLQLLNLGYRRLMSRRIDALSEPVPDDIRRKFAERE